MPMSTATSPVALTPTDQPQQRLSPASVASVPPQQRTPLLAGYGAAAAGGGTAFTPSAAPALKAPASSLSDVATLRQRVLELTRENTNLKDELIATRRAATAGQSNVQGKLFSQLLAARVELRRMRRRTAGLRSAYERLRQETEEATMTICDPVECGNLQLAADLTSPSNESRSQSTAAAASGPNSTRRQSLIGFHALQRAMGSRMRPTMAIPTPDDAVSLPEGSASEAYLTARVERSEFSRPLDDLRKGTLSNLKATFASVSKAIHALEYIFQDATRSDGILASPQADFKKTCSGLVKEVMGELKAVRRIVDASSGAVIDRESAVKKELAKRQVEGSSQVTQEDLDLLAKFNKAQQQAESSEPKKDDTDWAARCAEYRTRCATVEHALGQQRKKTKEAEDRAEAEAAAQRDLLSSLASSIFVLHDAAYRAVHAVYRHRFRWCPNCPNHFADIRRQPSKWDANKVQAVANAANKDASLLASFAEYFISDNLFGADLQHWRNRHLAGNAAVAAVGSGAASNASPGAGGLQEPVLSDDGEKDAEIEALSGEAPDIAATQTFAAGFKAFQRESGASTADNTGGTPAQAAHDDEHVVDGHGHEAVAAAGGRVSNNASSRVTPRSQPLSAQASAESMRAPSPEAQMRRSVTESALHRPSAVVVVGASGVPVGSRGAAAGGRRGSAPLGGGGRTDASPFTRMEEWTKKQSEMWSTRRASLTTTPVNVRLDDTPVTGAQQPAPRTKSTSPARPRSNAFLMRTASGEAVPSLSRSARTPVENTPMPPHDTGLAGSAGFPTTTEARSTGSSFRRRHSMPS